MKKFKQIDIETALGLISQNKPIYANYLGQYRQIKAIGIKRFAELLIKYKNKLYMLEE